MGYIQTTAIPYRFCGVAKSCSIPLSSTKKKRQFPIGSCRFFFSFHLCLFSGIVVSREERCENREELKDFMHLCDKVFDISDLN